MCWSIIPHQTEGELTYTGTYTELEEAFILSCGIRTCNNTNCTSCAQLKELRAQERVIKYLDSDAFKAGKIRVDTAQCDNILGFGNFTRAVFDMDPNVCKCHPLTRGAGGARGAVAAARQDLLAGQVLLASQDLVASQGEGGGSYS
jgi:hypothetical protein